MPKLTELKLFSLFSTICHCSSNGREARNRAEKNRRDKLNGSIQELSMMVPHVADSPRRVDKTAVLRFSAHTLRINYGRLNPSHLTAFIWNGSRLCPPLKCDAVVKLCNFVNFSVWKNQRNVSTEY